MDRPLISGCRLCDSARGSVPYKGDVVVRRFGLRNRRVGLSGVTVIALVLALVCAASAVAATTIWQASEVTMPNGGTPDSSNQAA